MRCSRRRKVQMERIFSVVIINVLQGLYVASPPFTDLVCHHRPDHWVVFILHECLAASV